MSTRIPTSRRRMQGKSNHLSNFNSPSQLAQKKQTTRILDAKYIIQIGEDDMEDIKSGHEAWKAAHSHLEENPKNPGLDLCQINPTTFPLGLFGEHLRAQSKLLHEKHSSAILIVRGFNFQPYSARDKLAIHAGISSWIGSERAVQNGDLSKDKNVAAHVIDMNIEKIHAEEPEKFVATANMTVSMPFHSDSGDIISLHYRHLAQTGGELFTASNEEIYQRMKKNFPNDLKVLEEEWEWHMPGNLDEVIKRPLIHSANDGNGEVRHIIQSERRPFFGHPQCRRPSHLKLISHEQEAALERIKWVAQSVCIKIPIQDDDIIFIHNLSNLHARSAFSDAGKNNNLQRHVVRMVVRDPDNSWSLPKGLVEQHWSMFERVSADEQTFSVHPVAMDAGMQHG